MSEILAINPRKKTIKKVGKKAAQTKDKKMAEKKKPAKKAIKKRRNNPGTVKKAARRAQTGLLGLNVGSAFKNSVPALAGALGALWTSKRFVDGGGLGDEEWEAKNYAMAGVGALGVSLLANAVKKGSGQKALEGGLVMMGIKLFEGWVIGKSKFAEEQFGDVYEDAYVMGEGEYEPGDMYLADDQETYVMGDDGAWYPASESHRDPMGETTAPPTSLGETTAPPTSLGEDAYAYAFRGADGGPGDPYAAIYHG